MSPPSEWIMRNVDDVIEPVAEHCAGRPLGEVRTALRRSWHAAFGVDPDEVTLGETAAAIHQRRDWRAAMWRAYWSPRVRAEAGMGGRQDVPAPRRRHRSEWIEFDPSEHLR